MKTTFNGSDQKILLSSRMKTKKWRMACCCSPGFVCE